jgi:hypothetical protein
LSRRDKTEPAAQRAAQQSGSPENRCNALCAPLLRGANGSQREPFHPL